MKIKLLIFLLIGSFLPIQAIASRSCHLQIEYSYEDLSYGEKELRGFRLYKNGEKICEVEDPNSRSFECDFQSDRGSFNFTLAPYFNDSSTGAQSPDYVAGIGLNELAVVQGVIKILL